MKTFFVKPGSIVREIWGKGDTILFIFAGASAEFALNKAVDWLYFTGKLPQDPLGRLFSTVSYARKIVFSEKQEAILAIENINAAHQKVETQRRKNIPDWAYRDVLFMLIDYSIRAFEILERTMTEEEKAEVYEVFREVGIRMNLKDLPKSYGHFQKMREMHLEQHLYNGEFSRDLYRQYRKHLGRFRYWLLLETQILLVPKKVRNLLRLRDHSLLRPFILGYKFSRNFHLDGFLRSLLLPPDFKQEIKSLDQISS